LGIIAGEFCFGFATPTPILGLRANAPLPRGWAGKDLKSRHRQSSRLKSFNHIEQAEAANRLPVGHA